MTLKKRKKCMMTIFFDCELYTSERYKRLENVTVKKSIINGYIKVWWTLFISWDSTQQIPVMVLSVHISYVFKSNRMRFCVVLGCYMWPYIEGYNIFAIFVFIIFMTFKEINIRELN